MLKLRITLNDSSTYYSNFEDEESREKKYNNIHSFGDFIDFGDCAFRKNEIKSVVKVKVEIENCYQQ